MSPERFLDRAAIVEAVQNWGLWRDTGRWDRLRSLYTADAIQHTTWFVGPAAEFIDRCVESAKRGGRSQHFIGASSVDLNGERDAPGAAGARHVAGKRSGRDLLWTLL
jgi:hypothetical protein